MAITSPAIETLRRAKVTFRLMPDADAQGEDPTEQTQGLIKPFRPLACFCVYREKLPPVFVVLSPERTITQHKVADAVADTITSIESRKPSDIATRLGIERAPRVPSRVIVDVALTKKTRHLMLPSGAKGQTIVISPEGLIVGFDAHVWDVSDAPVWERVEPYFAVTADGIRSLEPNKKYFHVSPGEIYFPEVRQIVSVGATDEYMECFDRALLAGKKHHPKPSQTEHAAAHFKFLKER
ncbi:hypothetical protein [Salinibacterium sp. SWN248]|uniref:hypothetical protein n=1 Tax=Salinibacterium sp. SWN248 TaxID=2792056 RepID=UPI0018CD4F5A|nr:hypothetical protein [Salinibacterium sp. SWN248]MBH0023813.1 hypothetical protein [Salinibacterium sp. SWN248]